MEICCNFKDFSIKKYSTLRAQCDISLGKLDMDIKKRIKTIGADALLAHFNFIVLYICFLYHSKVYQNYTVYISLPHIILFKKNIKLSAT